MVCGRGGIGRRAGFKIPFLWSVGSIPTARTTPLFFLTSDCVLALTEARLRLNMGNDDAQ